MLQTDYVEHRPTKRNENVPKDSVDSAKTFSRGGDTNGLFVDDKIRCELEAVRV